MVQEEITQLIKPTIEALGYILWGCEYLAQGRHSLLRIYIDKEDGITIEDCEQVSRQIGAVLDVEDPISGNYSLEVSSPGIPKPLFYLWQYHAYLGKEIQIKLYIPVAGGRKFVGTLISTDENNVILAIDDVQQKFIFSNIAKARVH